MHKYQPRDSENFNTFSVTNSINKKFMLPNKQSQAPRLNLIHRYSKVEPNTVAGFMFDSSVTLGFK